MKRLLIILLILTTACFGLLRKFEDDRTERWYQGYGNETEGMTLLRTNLFGINTITPSVELDVNGEINATTLNVTDLEATNLEADIDGTGYDLIIQDLNVLGATTINTLVVTTASITNALITNLEADIDATGYDISAIQDINAAGTVTANKFSDGVATLISGGLSGIVTLTATTITDGTATLSGGNVSGLGTVSATTVNASATVSANTLTDGVITISNGAISGGLTFTVTTMNITNLLVNNLESDLDGTGFTITANIISVTTANITNLGMDIVMGIYDITSITDINSSGTVTASYFVGDGSQITSLNADQLLSGTLPDARLTGEYTVTTMNATSFIGDLTGTATTANYLSDLDVTVSTANYSVTSNYSNNSNTANYSITANYATSIADEYTIITLNATDIVISGTFEMPVTSAATQTTGNINVPIIVNGQTVYLKASENL